eukprot:2699984-Amphidinium_carterae.1
MYNMCVVHALSGLASELNILPMLLVTARIVLEAASRIVPTSPRDSLSDSVQDVLAEPVTGRTHSSQGQASTGKVQKRIHCQDAQRSAMSLDILSDLPRWAGAGVPASQGSPWQGSPWQDSPWQDSLWHDSLWLQQRVRRVAFGNFGNPSNPVGGMRLCLQVSD